MSITREWPTITGTIADPQTVAAATNQHVDEARSAGRDPGGIVRETQHGAVTVRLARVLDGHGWLWHAEAVTDTGVVLSRLETFSSYDAVVEQVRLDAVWGFAAAWTAGGAL